MQIFASTTFLGPGRTQLEDVLKIIDMEAFDGLELGSTHVWQSEFADIITKNRPARVLCHNFFPPSKEPGLILNIASLNSENHKSTMLHIKHCIDFAAEIGAELYTIHPGFLEDPLANSSVKNNETAYDFKFSKTGNNFDEAYSIMIESLQELVSYSIEKELNLAIETEGSLTSPEVLLVQKPEEYEAIFKTIPEGLKLNFNLAHTFLASKHHGFSLKEFINQFSDRFSAIELSHNDGIKDGHMPLVEESYVFEWLKYLPDNIPLILEFRDATAQDLINSKKLLMAHSN